MHTVGSVLLLAMFSRAALSFAKVAKKNQESVVGN